MSKYNLFDNTCGKSIIYCNNLARVINNETEKTPKMFPNLHFRQYPCESDSFPRLCISPELNVTFRHFFTAKCFLGISSQVNVIFMYFPTTRCYF